MGQPFSLAPNTYYSYTLFVRVSTLIERDRTYDTNGYQIPGTRYEVRIIIGQPPGTIPVSVLRNTSMRFWVLYPRVGWPHCHTLETNCLPVQGTVSYHVISSLFERSEFLIATWYIQKKKSVRANDLGFSGENIGACVQLILVLA